MNTFMKLLTELSEADAFPQLILEIEDPDWPAEPVVFDVKDKNAHYDAWKEVSATEMTHVCFKNNEDHILNRMLVLPYEGEDMIGDWTTGINESLEFIIDRIVLS